MSTDQVDVLTDHSSRNLCARIRAGDSDAETVLITRLQSGLRLVAHRASGGDLELAHDVCQEALVILIRRLRTTGLEDPAGLEAFIAGQVYAAHNHIVCDADHVFLADERATIAAFKEFFRAAVAQSIPSV